MDALLEKKKKDSLGSWSAQLFLSWRAVSGRHGMERDIEGKLLNDAFIMMIWVLFPCLLQQWLCRNTPIYLQPNIYTQRWDLKSSPFKRLVCWSDKQLFRFFMLKRPKCFFDSSPKVPL